jgi:hypothetical protein
MGKPADSAETARPKTLVKWLDRSAIVLSTLCAVHCAVTPLLLAVLPFAASEPAELLFRRGLIGLGLVGVGLGIVIHRNRSAVLPFGLAAALAFVLEGSWSPLTHTMMSLALSALLITAHALNTRACASECSSCEPAMWWTTRIDRLGERVGRNVWLLAFSGAILIHAMLFALARPAMAETAHAHDRAAAHPHD